MSNQPTRKTLARVNERARARRQAEQRDRLMRRLPFVIGAAVVLFVVVIAIFVATNQPSSNAGGARAQVDREQIDFGNRVFDQPVRATFTVTNVGAGALMLDVPRVVTALEGC